MKNKEIKSLIHELCKNLEEELNSREIIKGKKRTNGIRTVSFDCGTRPATRQCRDMAVQTLAATIPSDEQQYVVELRVDDKVIFRESKILMKITVEEVEGILVKKLLRNIFTFGVMSSKKAIDEIENLQVKI